MKRRRAPAFWALIGLFTLSAVAQAAPGTWTATGSMATDRVAAAFGSEGAILLGNGKVLVAGGFSCGAGCFGVTPLSSAELYDPASGTWSPTGNMTTARFRHTITLLQNGKVLAAGGSGGASAELYDPASGTWSTTGSMATARNLGANATLLPNGKVLVTGGTFNGDQGFASAELYDPSTGTWSATGSMATGRYDHAAILLQNGKVLVAGGVNPGFLKSAELYDPATGTWSPTGDMVTARDGVDPPILLPNGKVLVAGGLIVAGSFQFIDNAELYDPATGTWSATGSLGMARSGHSMTLLPSGQVLAASGLINPWCCTWTASAELYDAVAGTWSATGSMATPRVAHAAIVLPNGKVLVAGGERGPDSATTATAELYEPPIVPFAAFDAKVEIELGPLANDDAFEVKGTFTLGAGSNGLDIPTEIVSLQLTGGTGAFSTTIPAGSFVFVPAKPGKPAHFKFEGVIGGVALQAKITPLGGNSFAFKAEGQGADLTGMVNPVTVHLTIGNDGGSATVTAEFE